jgi:ribosomal protein S18 acetylase RimI-like enzyme
LVEPTTGEILRFCEREPVERVFLEDVARRGHGRFTAVASRGSLLALCHLGTNVVPAGEGCGAFVPLVARTGARMIIGEERAVTELWEAGSERLPTPRADRPGQPVYSIDMAPAPGGTGLRPATLADLDLLVPACAASHREELGVDPFARDAMGFRWRTRAQIEEGRSWVWEEDGVILFKAEASAWTPSAVQLQQVWVDPQARRSGHARRALSDLIGMLLQRAPCVCLFVRADNHAAIGLYERIGMRRALTYRSMLF